MLDLIRPLVVSNTTKIVLLSLDGLGGLPRPETGRSELETAGMPNLAALASEAACGLLRHVAPGITPGSGPGHLGLFGYDPVRFQVGRGVLESLGIEFDLRAGDVAARGNFCTVDAQGRITDRRAGRIGTEVCVRLTERLRAIRLPGVEVFVEPVKEHRFVLVLRGPRLSGRLSETDPQVLGKPPLPVRALEPAAGATADLVNRFVTEAGRLLHDAAPANMVLLRGFDQLPELPRFPEVYGMRAAAIAAYPMYRGLAKLVGMDVLKTGARSRARSRRSASTGRPTTSSSYTTRTPTRPERTATSTARWRPSSASTRTSRRSARSVPMSSSCRATTPRPRCSRATAGSRSRRSCGAATVAPIPSPHSPSGRARRAASARSPRITSCRSSWPTPRG